MLKEANLFDTMLKQSLYHEYFLNYAYVKKTMSWAL